MNKEQISKLSLGTVQLGMSYGIANTTGQPAPVIRQSILRTALSLGINCFDTARNYGNAEDCLGEFFAQETGDYCIVSKFHVPENCNRFSELDAVIREQLAASLQALRLERLPIYLFHQSMHQQDPALLEKITRVMEALIGEGQIGQAGVSVYYPAFAATLLDNPVLDSLQIPFNLLDHRLLQDGLLQQLQARAKTIFIRSVYVQGLIFRDPDTLTGNLTGALPYLRTLRRLAAESGRPIAELALQFVNGFAGITSLVMGAETPEQVRQTVTMMQEPPLEAELQQHILDSFHDIPEHLVIPARWSL